jgi:hypothetical protein
MFRVYLVPRTPFFFIGLHFAHGGFTVRGGFQERNPRERQECAVFHSETVTVFKLIL